MSSKLGLEGSWGRGAAPMLPRGVSRCPLRLKMDPKWCQNGTKNGATTHMIERSAVPLSSEMREMLALPLEQPREERSWHTHRAAPRRETRQYPESSTTAITCSC